MSSAPPLPLGAPHTVVGRYAVFDEIASGGMATVHLGRLLGAAGFSRMVAIKRLHPQFARDQEFAAMFMDEARLASRINHPNVVQTIDVVPEGKDILLVMEYVHGVPFAQLLGTSRRTGWRVPARIIAGVMVGALEGLHAAHEARSETGQPLGVVHRDVSPQNILVGVEGTARVIDFGVAKAIGKMHATREGQLKGKLCYMSPEQIRGVEVTRVSDVFSAAIVLWEALMAERLFDGKNPAELIMQVLSAEIRPPRSKFPDLPEALEAVVMKGIDRDPTRRFTTAREMAVALEAATDIAPAREIAEWVESMAGSALVQRARLLEAIERAASAPPTSGERTRVEGLMATLGTPPGLELVPERGPGLESGPQSRPAPLPLAGALPAADRDALGLAATLQQEGVPDVEPGRRGPGSGPLALPVPADPTTPAPFSPTPAPLGPPAALDPAAGKPPPRAGDGPVVRRPRVPVRVEAARDEALDRAALRERLAWPVRLLVAGVAFSLVDFVLRLAGVVLPVRPSWLAAILVVAGVVWGFARVFLPSRDD